MLQSPLPGWLRQQINVAIAGYRVAIALCEERCKHLAREGRKNEDGLRCDDYGSITDYRLDAKYYAGQLARLPLLLEGRITREEWEEGNWRELPTDPGELAPWAWLREGSELLPEFLPPPPPIPEPEPQLPPMEALRKTRFDDRFDEYDITQREAEALILCRGLGMKPAQAADVMECSPRRVSEYLHNAREKLKIHDLLGKSS